jgi:hypothetical protein
MKTEEGRGAPVSEEASPGLQLIRELRSFFCNPGRQAPPSVFERPSDWHCPGCNVWGRDLRPATCWCCGAEEVDYRVQPSMTGSHRRHEPSGQGA